MKKYQSNAPLLLAIFLAAMVLFPCLATIPGLHGDEAWAGLRAHEILQGARPIIGMNTYTGPIHQYLVAAFFGIFGCKVNVLRLLTGLTAVTSVFLYHRIFKRQFGPEIANLATLILVSLPFFTAYGRLAHEVFALNPILALGAIVLLLESNEGPYLIKIISWFLSGICLGLGVWNHFIFITVPIALLAATVFRHGVSLFRSSAVYIVAYGFVLGLLPRLLFQLSSGQTVMPRATLRVAFIRRLIEWPGLLLQFGHGDLLYQRFAGEVLLKTPNLIFLILIVAVVARLANRERGTQNTNGYGMAVFVFGSALFLSTVLLCPSNSDRYFLLMLYLMPLLLACAFKEIFQVFALKRWSSAIFCIFILLQLGRTGINYFYSQIQSGGRSSAFLTGSQRETSNHFMRSDLLYRELVSRGAKAIYTESLLAWPLQFYDSKNKNFKSVNPEDLVRAPPSERVQSEGAYAIFYADGIRQIQPDQYPDYKMAFQDTHFIVMEPIARSK